MNNTLSPGINREKAKQIITEKCDFALQRHLTYVAEAMQSLCVHLGKENELEFWYVAGLLHDIDWNETINNPQEHCGEKTINYLKSCGASDELCTTIQSHYTALNIPLDTDVRKALFACDELSGFIVAAALVRPTKMIGISAKSIQKKMKDKAFARQVDREDMKSCESFFNIPLSEFINILLPGFEKIAPQWELA